ncbi:VMO1 protein, partial [Neopipo cinnamomea]|nr:VMO1 protein [Neopipo cinnamomea]
GEWSRPETCPPGQRLLSFRLRVEAPRGIWDDTAANAAAAVCSGGTLLEGTGGPRGSWGNWSLPCPGQGGVCGLRTRVEPPRRAADDTGLNDAELYCCQ